MSNDWRIELKFSENDDGMDCFAMEAGLKDDANPWELVDGMLALVGRTREEVIEVSLVRIEEDGGDDE